MSYAYVILICVFVCANAFVNTSVCLIYFLVHIPTYLHMYKSVFYTRTHPLFPHLNLVLFVPLISVANNETCDNDWP